MIINLRRETSQNSKNLIYMKGRLKNKAQADCAKYLVSFRGKRKGVFLGGWREGGFGVGGKDVESISRFRCKVSNAC